MKKILSYISILSVLMLILSSCGGGRVVKTLGEYEVSAEMDEFFDGDTEKEAMFFAPYVLAKEISFNTESKAFTDAVDAEIERILAEDYKGLEDDLEEELEKNGISRTFYEKLVEQDVLKRELYFKLISNGTIVKDAKELRELFLDGAAVRVKRILIMSDGAEQTIKEASEKISRGTPFEDVMKEYAEYDLAKGDLGNYGDSYVLVKGNSELGYEEVCFSLEEGEVSEPFETSAGWCIVKRYELTEDVIDDLGEDLITSYCEGRFNMILEKQAEKLK